MADQLFLLKRPETYNQSQSVYNLTSLVLLKQVKNNTKLFQKISMVKSPMANMGAILLALSIMTVIHCAANKCKNTHTYCNKRILLKRKRYFQRRNINREDSLNIKALPNHLKKTIYHVVLISYSTTHRFTFRCARACSQSRLGVNECKVN